MNLLISINVWFSASLFLSGIPNIYSKNLISVAALHSNIKNENIDQLKPKLELSLNSKTPASQPATHLSYNFSQLQLNWERQNLDNGYSKDQWPYPNQYQDAKPQSGTSSVLQSPKWGLKGHGCSLHLQNQARGPKFGSWLYQRPVTIFISRSRCQTPVRNL